MKHQGGRWLEPAFVQAIHTSCAKVQPFISRFNMWSLEFILSSGVDSTIRAQKRCEPFLSLRELAPIKIWMRSRLPNRRILVSLSCSRKRTTLEFTSARKDVQDVPKWAKACKIDPESDPRLVPAALFLGRKLYISISRCPNRLFCSLARIANASELLPRFKTFEFWFQFLIKTKFR